MGADLTGWPESLVRAHSQKKHMPGGKDHDQSNHGKKGDGDLQSLAEKIAKQRFERFTRGEGENWAETLRNIKDGELRKETYYKSDTMYQEMLTKWVSDEAADYLSHANTESAKQNREVIMGALSGAIREQIKDTDQQERYIEAMGLAVEKMPEKALQAVVSKLGLSHFYPDTKSLAKGIEGTFGSNAVSVDEGETIGGMFAYYRNRGYGELYLDGGEDTEHTGEIYAHELGHAIDRGIDKNHPSRFSSRPEWEKAWAQEIKTGGTWAPLSSYAKTSSEEGFAEYVRLLSFDTEKAIRKFPKSWSVWKKASTGE